MKQSVINKALFLRERGGITRDGNVFYVPSATSSAVYTVNGHVCSCPSLRICSHSLATTYLDALLAIQLMQYAESLDFLAAIVDAYSERVEAMPAKVRAAVKAEYLAAKSRLSGAMPEQYSTRTVKEGEYSTMVVSRVEAARDYGAIAIT